MPNNLSAYTHGFIRRGWTSAQAILRNLKNGNEQQLMGKVMVDEFSLSWIALAPNRDRIWNVLSEYAVWNSTIVLSRRIIRSRFGCRRSL